MAASGSASPTFAPATSTPSERSPARNSSRCCCASSIPACMSAAHAMPCGVAGISRVNSQGPCTMRARSASSSSGEPAVRLATTKTRALSVMTPRYPVPDLLHACRRFRIIRGLMRLATVAFAVLLVLACAAGVAQAAPDDLHLASRTSDPAVVAGDDDSQLAAISADGRYVAFTSDADNLAVGDDDLGAVFVRDLVAGTTTNVFRQDGGTAYATGGADQ